MKTAKNINAYTGILKVLSAAVAALVLSCAQPTDSPTAPPAPSGKGTVILTASATGGGPAGISASVRSGPSLTVLPAATPDFSKYEVVFSKDDSEDVPISDAQGLAGDGLSQELEAGDWTVTVTAYRKFTVAGGSEKEYAAAAGSDTVTVSAGQTAEKTVDIAPIPVTETAGKGIFVYKITFPEGASGVLRFGEEEGVALVSGAEVSVEKDPGYYDLYVSVTKGALSAAVSEKAHIYAGLESKLEYTFTTEDFTVTVYLAGTLALPEPVTVSSGQITGYSDTDHATKIFGPVAVTASGKGWTAAVPAADIGSGTIYLSFAATGSDGKTYNGTGDTGGAVSEAGKQGISLSDSTPPAGVTGLNAAAGNGQAVLAWTDPADADLDHIEVTWTNGGNTAQTVANGTGHYTATSLSNGTSYTFTVKAVDTSGNKDNGTIATATPAAPVEPGASGAVDASDVFSTNDLKAVAWGNGTFVAGGNTNDSDWNLGYSTDGVTWARATTGPAYTKNVLSISFGKNNIFIAGGSGTQQMVGSADNGVTWSKTKTGAATGFTSATSNIVTAYGSDTFVAVAREGNFSYWKPGSKSWSGTATSVFTNGGAPIADSVYVNAVSWTGNRFVVVGADGKIAVSTDGTTAWMPQTSGVSTALKAVAGNGAVTVAVGETGAILSSSDEGVTWTTRTAPSGINGSLNAVIWAGDKFIAAGAGGKIIYSADGAAWNDAAVSGTADINGLAWNGSVLVAVGVGGTVYAWEGVN